MTERLPSTYLARNPYSCRLVIYSPDTTLSRESTRELSITLAPLATNISIAQRVYLSDLITLTIRTYFLSWMKYASLMNSMPI